MRKNVISKITGYSRQPNYSNNKIIYLALKKGGYYLLTIPAKFNVGQGVHYHFLYVTGTRHIWTWNTPSTKDT